MNTYFVAVEEFVPRDSVKHMLQLAEKLEHLEPVEAKKAFKDLKRAMVWMEKYIAPTSEFWEWTNDTFRIDSETQLTVQLLGFGWAVAVVSLKPISLDEVSSEEKRLIHLMETLTQHIPVKAVLRMKSSHWSKHDVKDVARVLELNGVHCELHEWELWLNGTSVKIQFEPEERLEFSGISRETAKKIEDVLSRIKEYANQKLEGANWCAYNRRRLTLVQKIGPTELTDEEQRFLLHPEYGAPGKVLVSKVKTSDGKEALFAFVRAKYHLGNIHPRALIAVNESEYKEKEESSGIREFITYIYYLWNSHYTRVRLYLLFEDVYAYAEKLLSTGQYIDPKILDDWHNYLRADEIIVEMTTHERVDKGDFQTYRPPHGKFKEVDTPEVDPLEFLRKFLIEATTTQLYEDPLKGAVKLLIKLDEQMKAALTLFIQTVDIRIQRSLQTLQFLFVIAAVGQIVQLISPSSVLTAIMPGSPSQVVISILNILILVVITFVVLALLRLQSTKRFIEKTIK